MKKLRLVCSAIAALTVLALAGCDLEVDDKVVTLTSDFEPDSLPFTYSESVVFQDSTLAALDGVVKSDNTKWTAADGVSLSFYLDGYTSDWSMIFQVPSSNFGTTTVHHCTEKTWYANSFGVSDGNGGWDEFLNAAPSANGTGRSDYGPCYVTISMNYSDGTMSFYKNGVLLTTYGGSTSPYGFASYAGKVTGAEWVKGIVDDIAASGIYCIHPSDTWANASAGDYKMRYFVVDAAVDAAGAAAKYAAYQAWAAEQE